MVNRYKFQEGESVEDTGLVEDDFGYWVEYPDYAALQAENERLKAEQPAGVDGAARRRDVRLWMRHDASSYSTATELAEAADKVFNLPDGGLDNETHWVWDEAVEAIDDAQREELS